MKKKCPIADVKNLTPSQFCLAAAKMPDQESADQFVESYAARHELDVDYVRWYVVNWMDRCEPKMATQARALYQPQAHAQRQARHEALQARGQTVKATAPVNPKPEPRPAR